MTSQDPAPEQEPSAPQAGQPHVAVAWAILLIGVLVSTWLTDWTLAEKVFWSSAYGALGSLLVGWNITHMPRRRRSK